MSNVTTNNDYNRAKVMLYIQEDQGGLGLVETHAQLDYREARKVAIDLLQAAEKMEAQRAINLKRAQEAMRTGHVDAAAEIAQANGFTDDELNGG